MVDIIRFDYAKTDLGRTPLNYDDGDMHPAHLVQTLVGLTLTTPTGWLTFNLVPA